MRVELGPRMTIICGDAYNCIGGLSPKYCLITDPPWGIGWAGSHNTARTNGTEFLRKDGDFLPILGDDRPFDPAPFLEFKTVCLWGANNFSHLLPPSRGWLVWDKLAGKAPNDGSDCELAWTNRSMPARLYTHLWRGMMRAGEENIARSRKLHPHQKPVALMAWSLRVLSVTVDDTVVDPFMGSGSLGVACHRMGVSYVGIEMDPHYYGVAHERLEKELRQPLLL